MISKQDLQGARTPAELERRYNFGKSFAEAMGIATDAREAAEEAKQSVVGLNESLTSDEIFNRLTNDGEDQGIYRESGKIFINANFIKAGSISSDMIKAGVIRSIDYKSNPLPFIYPAENLYPSVSLYPSNGETITQGIEIDFEAGVIRGVFFSDVTNELAARITALEKAVFN